MTPTAPESQKIQRYYSYIYTGCATPLYLSVAILINLF